MKRPHLGMIVGLVTLCLSSTGQGNKLLGQSATNLQTITWSASDTPVITLTSIDCALKGSNKIVVDGVVELKHPQDTSDSPQAPVIKIRCQEMEFRPGAEIHSTAELDFQIRGTATGRIIIKGTRGSSGKDGEQLDANYEKRKADNGVDGTPGNQGRSAETDLKGDWGADRGDPGRAGTRGTDGKDGVETSPGGNARSAANVRFVAGVYAPGTTIVIEARGGAGGIGAKGGRGVDGGNGGIGGNGGHGGDGNAIHSGESGGDGGAGGDGGDGGNGGKGGAGGYGGDGGRITIGRFEGAPAWPLDDLDNSGGTGGQGGEGGDPGEGGKGGRGGFAGCGGSGGKFIFNTTGGGSCGTDGKPGKDGHDGKKGPPGAWGHDGRNGQQNTVEYVTLPKGTA